MECDRCFKESYVIYVGDWGQICPECEDVRREMENEDKGWDHDDLDCPEYGEIIVQKGGFYDGKKEEVDIHRGEASNR